MSCGAILTEFSSGCASIEYIDGHKQDYLNRNKYTKRQKAVRWVNRKCIVSEELKHALGYYAKQHYEWRINHGIKTVTVIYNSDLLK